MFFTFFYSFSPVFLPKSEVLPLLFAQSLFFIERGEQFTLVALHKRENGFGQSLKRATVSDSLPSIITKERQEQFTLFYKRIAILLFCYFAHKKTRDSLKKPR